MEIIISCFDGLHEADQVQLSFLTAEYVEFEDAVVVVRTSIGQLKWLRWTRTMAEVHPSTYRSSGAIVDTILQNQKIVPYNHAAEDFYKSLQFGSSRGAPPLFLFLRMLRLTRSSRT